MSTNWPKSKVIDGQKVEFWKPNNTDLSRVYRHMIANASKAKSTDESDLIAAMFSGDTYEQDRADLFRTVNIEGIGFIDTPQALDKMLDAHGFNFELALFSGAWEGYLGEASRRVSVPASTDEQTDTTPAVNTPGTKSTGSSGVRSSERLPRTGK